MTGVGVYWSLMLSFFGFTSNTAFTTVTFRHVVNDVHGIDNVTYATSVVPVPAALWLFASGLGLPAGLRRYKGVDD